VLPGLPSRTHRLSSIFRSSFWSTSRRQHSNVQNWAMRSLPASPTTPPPSTLAALLLKVVAPQSGRVLLGRTDIGSLEAGKCADFCAINLNRLDYAGALHDPVAAVVFCQPVRVDFTVAGGKFVVKEGQLVSIDEHKQVEKHNQAAKHLLESR